MFVCVFVSLLMRAGDMGVHIVPQETGTVVEDRSVDQQECRTWTAIHSTIRPASRRKLHSILNALQICFKYKFLCVAPFSRFYPIRTTPPISDSSSNDLAAQPKKKTNPCSVPAACCDASIRSRNHRDACPPKWVALVAWTWTSRTIAYSSSSSQELDMRLVFHRLVLFTKDSNRQADLMIRRMVPGRRRATISRQRIPNSIKWVMRSHLHLNKWGKVKYH